MAQSDEIRIFYSWQSDSPPNTNKNAIRGALRTARDEIEADQTQLHMVLDEATSDTPGSPNIALEILKKIKDADVIVVDVTTITEDGATRPCPNPNVTFELGYAVAHLGWERVILLFNQEFGDFPKDLPFDFKSHRIKPYRLAESAPQSVRNLLTKFLKEAITTIIDKNPERPAETRGLSREKIKHDRDVQNMRWLMSTIHLPTMDRHIQDLPRRIADPAIWMYEGFSDVASSSLFSIYDPALKEAVDQLFQNWSRALSYTDHYHTTGGRHAVFISPGDVLRSDEDRDAWNDILEARVQMREALNVILDRLQESYLELDIHAMSEAAGKRIDNTLEEMED